MIAIKNKIILYSIITIIALSVLISTFFVENLQLNAADTTETLVFSHEDTYYNISLSEIQYPESLIASNTISNEVRFSITLTTDNAEVNTIGLALVTRLNFYEKGSENIYVINQLSYFIVNNNEIRQSLTGSNTLIADLVFQFTNQYDTIDLPTEMEMEMDLGIYLSFTNNSDTNFFLNIGRSNFPTIRVERGNLIIFNTLRYFLIIRVLSILIIVVMIIHLRQLMKGREEGGN